MFKDLRGGHQEIPHPSRPWQHKTKKTKKTKLKQYLYFKAVIRQNLIHLIPGSIKLKKKLIFLLSCRSSSISSLATSIRICPPYQNLSPLFLYLRIQSPRKSIRSTAADWPLLLFRLTITCSTSWGPVLIYVHGFFCKKKF